MGLFRRVFRSTGRCPTIGSGLWLLICLATVGSVGIIGQGQTKLSPAEILAAAVENGSRTDQALRQYTFFSELTIEMVGPGDLITGKYTRLSKIFFDRSGARQERLVEEKSTLPPDSLISPAGLGRLVEIYRFNMNRRTAADYDFNYIGREQVDEINTYVFDVKPRGRIPESDRASERYLKGRVWIDDTDLQVVKVSGDVLPEPSPRRTPKFETYFQNHDKYWFPAYSSADDDLRIGHDHVRVLVTSRYTSFSKTSRP